MKRVLSALLAGSLFGVGLALSGMTAPRKIIAFLDVGGRWDPALALVMIGAVAVFSLAYRWSRRLAHPLAGPAFSTLPRGRIEPRLIVGSVVFGVGWGVAGFCPGPALVSLATGTLQVIVFCLAMFAGFWLTKRVDARIQRRSA